MSSRFLSFRGIFGWHQVCSQGTNVSEIILWPGNYISSKRAAESKPMRNNPPNGWVDFPATTLTSAIFRRVCSVWEIFSAAKSCRNGCTRRRQAERSISRAVQAGRTKILGGGVEPSGRELRGAPRWSRFPAAWWLPGRWLQMLVELVSVGARTLAEGIGGRKVLRCSTRQAVACQPDDGVHRSPFSFSKSILRLQLGIFPFGINFRL